MCFQPNRLDSVISSLRRTAKDILCIVNYCVRSIYVYTRGRTRTCVRVCVCVQYMCVFLLLRRQSVRYMEKKQERKMFKSQPQIYIE